jgi:hypothetical protein
VEVLAGAIAAVDAGAMAAVDAGAIAAVEAGAMAAVDADIGEAAGAAVAAAGGVESAGADEESSLLPQALRDRTAASEAAQIRVRVIFIQTSPVSKGLEGNFLHLTGSDPIGVHTLITTGIKSGFHASALPSNYQATTYRLSPAAAVVEDRPPAGRSTVASFRRGIREITGRIAAPDHPSSPK